MQSHDDRGRSGIFQHAADESRARLVSPRAGPVASHLLRRRSSPSTHHARSPPSPHRSFQSRSSSVFPRPPPVSRRVRARPRSFLRARRFRLGLDHALPALRRRSPLHRPKRHLTREPCGIDGDVNETSGGWNGRQASHIVFWNVRASKGSLGSRFSVRGVEGGFPTLSVPGSGRRTHRTSRTVPRVRAGVRQSCPAGVPCGAIPRASRAFVLARRRTSQSNPPRVIPRRRSPPRRSVGGIGESPSRTGANVATRPRPRKESRRNMGNPDRDDVPPPLDLDRGPGLGLGPR